jgi:RNA polymerase sigma factor (TIGR02999 family)
MSSPSSKDVSQLLVDLNRGDQDALAKLIPLVYDELRALADSYMRRERSSHTLQPTALVHEAFLRLVDEELHLENRAHFFGVAAQAMRQILVEHARARHALKRGGEAQKLSLDEAMDQPEEREVDLMALDDALNDLARFDPRQARIVELRYFAGLTIEETARLLGISPAMVKREWNLARAWLHREISSVSDLESQI